MGLEPMTFRLTTGCSVQLSYGSVCAYLFVKEPANVTSPIQRRVEDSNLRAGLMASALAPRCDQPLCQPSEIRASTCWRD